MPQLSGQQFLPGMERMRSDVPSRLSFNDTGARNYRGPIPGQLVMGVKNLGGDALGHPSRRGHDNPFYEVDHTGFVQDAEHHGGKWVSPVEIAANSVSRPAAGFYRSHGGGRADEGTVQYHWSQQPLHTIHPDTPIHTQQDPNETLHDPWFENAPSGRDRVNAIRSSLQNGQPIRKAAWLMKHSGRLYALDGHHRMLAAREEGQSFPAHVWDVDAQDGRR